jgi:hypothetical protein
VPGLDGPAGLLPERAAGRQLVGQYAAERVTDLTAAQQPVDVRTGRGVGQLGEGHQRGQRGVPAAGHGDQLARVPGPHRWVVQVGHPVSLSCRSPRWEPTATGQGI